jgi:hypothetical protein
MNNSDQNDFNNWQNGDENEMNNPNNWSHGFFYYNNADDAFKNIWKNLQPGQSPMDYMKEYFNMDEFPKKQKRPSFKQRNSKQSKTTILTQDDYLKLVEIRGYLNITEQYAHVKALDKLLNQIQIVTKDNK